MPARTPDGRRKVPANAKTLTRRRRVARLRRRLPLRLLRANRLERGRQFVDAADALAEGERAVRVGRIVRAGRKRRVRDETLFGSDGRKMDERVHALRFASEIPGTVVGGV